MWGSQTMDEQETEWQRISLPSDGESQVYLEVLHQGGREEVGVLDAIPFEQVTNLLGDISTEISKTLEKAKPKKATVELGVEFGLKDGALVALIARGSGKANLKIGLEWERP